MKTGFAARRMQLNNGVINAQFNGSLRFNNVNDFLAGRPASYTRNFGQPYVGLRATEFNTFFQDDWQVTSRLLLNLGVRYEYNQAPREVNGLIAEKYRLNSDPNNLAPRFGFAYRADKAGKSVVRGGYGIYYNVLELVFVGLGRFNPPLITSHANAAPQFSNLLAGLRSTIPSGLVYPQWGSEEPLFTALDADARARTIQSTDDAKRRLYRHPGPEAAVCAAAQWRRRVVASGAAGPGTGRGECVGDGTEVPAIPTSASWSPTGEMLRSYPLRGLLLLPKAGCTAELITKPDNSRGEIGHGRPWFLPDGKNFLYTTRNEKPEGNAIYLTSLNGKTPKHS